MAASSPPPAPRFPPSALATKRRFLASQFRGIVREIWRKWSSSVARGTARYTRPSFLPVNLVRKRHVVNSFPMLAHAAASSACTCHPVAAYPLPDTRRRFSEPDYPWLRPQRGKKERSVRRYSLLSRFFRARGPFRSSLILIVASSGSMIG